MTNENSDRPEAEKDSDYVEDWSQADITRVIIILYFSCGFISGIINSINDITLYPSARAGPTEICKPWFSKRWHYALPLYQIGCKATYWISEVEDR